MSGEAGRRFHFFYTERGLDSPPEKIFDDEAEACQYYYGFVMNIRHNHLVGFYQSLASLRRHAASKSTASPPATTKFPTAAGTTRATASLSRAGPFSPCGSCSSLPLNDQAELPEMLD